MKTRLLLLFVLLLLPTMVSARWIQDKSVIKTEGAGPIEFSHYNHLEAVGKNCPSCHNSLFNIVASKNPRVSMADMEKGKSCGACHNGTKAFSVKGDCANCHPTKTVTFKVPDAGDVDFSHDVHTGMFKCNECHPALFVTAEGKSPKTTMEQMEKGSSCGQCHEGGTAFSVKENCDKCHKM